MFQSTLPVKGATYNILLAKVLEVSIHAPSEGSDGGSSQFAPLDYSFQSTLPVKGATRETIGGEIRKPFQSTLPVKGATMLPFFSMLGGVGFNPRSQ